MGKILLLNPPGIRTYTRDYFCSKVTKVQYIEHPVDFIILSGILAKEHSVTFLDATLRKYSEEKTIQRISSNKPDALIFLSGTASWNEDFPFMRRVRELLPTIPFIGIGDIFREKRVLASEHWLDAIILDFTSEEILPYLRGELAQVHSMIYRDGGHIHDAEKTTPQREFILPIPKHELFLNLKYRFPFARYLPFATLLTDFGCPYKCRFCLYGTLPFKMRPVANVVEELRLLQQLGVREFFMKDQAFAVHKERATQLCEEITRLGNFSWTCFLRADCADEKVLLAMKKAGCHTIMFGIESGNEAILKKYEKGVNKAMTRESISLCHSLGLNTVGIFILGFPEETQASISETIDFAMELDCDYASFNVFVPKIQTPARKELIENQTISDNPFEIQDQSGFLAQSFTCQDPGLDLNEWRNYAISRFYGRPSYIFKRLRKVSTFHEFRTLVTSAFTLFRQYKQT